MYSVWLVDLTKAVAAIRKKTGRETFCSVRGNANGDYVFDIDEDTTYLVDGQTFSVWQNINNWRNAKWIEIK